MTTPDNIKLAEMIAGYRDDPLGFVRVAFPWGEPGALHNETGPDANQTTFLESLGREIRSRGFAGAAAVMPIRMALSSGHGTGKSALGAMLACFILSTRPWSKGTVTAGTATQLEERTWTAIREWMAMCITSGWFDIQARGIYVKSTMLKAGESSDGWKLVAQTCKEENAQSFAGQHAKNSTSWYLFDEASTIPSKIWQVAYGGLTDGEPMIFAWGQPERNTGEFYDVCFGKLKERWIHRTLDSRFSRFTNKELIAEWERDYGVDSDWYRVRVLGLPPKASELQYIDKERIEQSQKRDGLALPHDALIVGLDVSGGGSAWNVFRFRKGLDARSIPAVKIPGDNGKEREAVISRAAEMLRDHRPGRSVAMMFIDSAFGSPIYERLRVLGFDNVVEVNFGSASPDVHCLNMRAYMAKECKDWLLRGSLDPEDAKLAEDLAMPGYHINRSGKLVIEEKKEVAARLGRSPDDGDALWLTFAQVVGPDNAATVWEREVVGSGVLGGHEGWLA